VILAVLYAVKEIAIRPLKKKAFEALEP